MRHVAPWLWDWPHRFTQRMEAAGSSVYLLGDFGSETHSTSFDDPERFRALPDGFDGGVWADRIDLLGSAAE